MIANAPATKMTLDAYLTKYGKLIQENAQASMDPLYVPGRDKPVSVSLIRKPFVRQADAINGAVRSLDRTNSLFICGEMGTGKTLMGQGTVHAHAKGQPYRALVFCPGQLTLKWERELRETIPGVVVHQLSEWRDVFKLQRGTRPTAPTWYIISRDRAKLGAYWNGAFVTKTEEVERLNNRNEVEVVKLEYVHCPRCGQRQMDEDVPMEPDDFHNDKRCCNALLPGTGDTCGEPLWTYNRRIDRWEPAHYIKRKLKGFFDYLIVDEVHEEKSASSAQANAAGALMASCKYTIALTGTLIGGYAEHLRPLLFRMCPQSVIGEGFTWDEALPFSEKYGRIETRVTEKDSGGSRNAMSRGRSDRSVTRNVRPGIVPTLVKHILGNTVFLSLADVAENLPDLQETLVPVPMDPDMESYYREMEDDLTAAVKQAFTSGAKKMLGPMLNALLNWPDHPHDWPELGYKDKDGMWIGVHQPFNYPENYKVWPKEEELIKLVKQERAQGRQVWIYVQLTDKHDVAGRLQELLKAEGMNVAVMRSTVAPAKREAWIQKHCKGVDVCISHPKLVETGLDLFDKKGNHNFSTLIFYETGYNLFTMRQAARRSWRIGQHMLCKVYYMYYEDSMQERAMTLMGRKLTAAEALEGKFSSEGLAALVGEDESLELAMAKSLAEQSADLAARDAWRLPEPEPFIPAPVLPQPVVLPPKVTLPPPPATVTAGAVVTTAAASTAASNLSKLLAMLKARKAG